MVFLASIEVVRLRRQNRVLARIIGLHSIVFGHFALIAFLSQICVLILLLFKLLLSHSLVGNREIFVESVTLYFKVKF
jgi:hypothetical protein